MKYAAIADWAADKLYPVTFMCAQLGLARQGYYRWLTQGPCQRERSDGELTEQIRTIYHQLDGNPGVRRVWAELVVQGVRVARKRVWRLMRAAGLQGRHPKPWKRTTIAGQRPIDAADLIGQDFTAEQPNTRWCGDITYVQTVDGWAYTATVIDLHSRKIVGYAVADHLRTSLIVEALNAALCTRRPATGVIFHSDRGCQYQCRSVREFRVGRSTRCRPDLRVRRLECSWCARERSPRVGGIAPMLGFHSRGRLGPGQFFLDRLLNNRLVACRSR